jgi:hypothetical protein
VVTDPPIFRDVLGTLARGRLAVLHQTYPGWQIVQVSQRCRRSGQELSPAWYACLRREPPEVLREKKHPRAFVRFEVSALVEEIDAQAEIMHHFRC